MSDLLEIENLSVSFDTPQGELEAVRDVSFSLRSGRGARASWANPAAAKASCARPSCSLLPSTARIREGKYPCKRHGHITAIRKREMQKLRG